MKAETANIAAAAAGASIAAGTVLGVPVLSLMFGLAGGLVALTWNREPLVWWRVVLTLVASTVSGAALGPFIAAHIHVETIERAVEVIACSFIVGAGFQAILQAFIAAAVNRINQAGGRP